MLERLYPLRDLLDDPHPLVRVARARLPSVQGIGRHTWRRFWVWLGVFGALWGIAVLLGGRTAGSFSGQILNLCLMGTFFANHLLELRCLALTFTTISDEKRTGRWDLLRLTTIRRESIVEAHYRLSQIYLWQATMGVIAMRAALLMVVAIHNLLLPQMGGSGALQVNRFGDMLLFNGLLITLAAFVYAYLADPMWHMRAFTALGLMASARTSTLMSAVTVVLPLCLVIWVVEFLVTFVMSTALIFITSFLGFCLSPVATVMTLRAMYGQIARWALRSAIHHAFKDGY